MPDDTDDLFGSSDFVTTPNVAAFVGLSETKVREYAADLEVSMAGNAFIWTRANVEALLEELEPSDEDDDEDSEDEDPDDEEDDDADPDDEDDEDADEDDEEEDDS